MFVDFVKKPFKSVCRVLVSVFGLAFALGFFTLPSTAMAEVEVEFADGITDAINNGGADADAERRRIEREFNRGLRRLGRTNAGARALFNSSQTIRIVCYGDPEAGDLEPAAGILAVPAETLGDFDAAGNPKRNGKAIIVIDCGTVQARGGFYKVPEGGFTPALFEVLVHELLHATNRARVHAGEGTDSLDLYRQWERDFLRVLSASSDSTDSQETSSTPAPSGTTGTQSADSTNGSSTFGSARVGEVRVPIPAGRSAASRMDFGGGSTLGALIGGFDPAAVGGRSSGLITSRIDPFVTADGMGRFAFYGQVNNGYIVVNNRNPGKDNAHFATNGASTNFLGFRGRYDFTDAFRVSARVSVTGAFNRTDIKNDFSTYAGCNERFPDRTFCLYDASIAARSTTFGKLSIGVGETAFYGVGDTTLGGTASVTNADPSVMAGLHEVFGLGAKFAEVAPDTAGVKRGTRVRYTSPTIAGFVLSGSAGRASHTGAPADSDGFYDVALRYAGEFGAIRVAAGAGFQNYRREGGGRSQSNATASGSIMHVPTGLFLTGSGTGLSRDATAAPAAGRSETASAFYVQAGISQNFFGIGKTTLFGEYGQTNGGADAGDYFLTDSKTTKFGAGIVQNIDPAAMQIYLQYKHLEAEKIGTKGDPIDIIFAGSRIRF